MSLHLDLPQLRLLDANANRAREGLRTAEDYLRFMTGESRWVGKLKAIRHSITEKLHASVSAEALVAARNVGTDPLRPAEPAANSAERDAESPKAIAHRGLKRAQEALRVLEEYLRQAAPATSAHFANHRYQVYDAEQWLIGAGETACVFFQSRVYVLLTENLCPLGLMKTAEAVVKGGVRLLQLREKTLSDSVYLAKARDLRSFCDQSGAVLICNDRVDLALLAGARAIHVGQDDLSPVDARRVSGQRMVIGRSTHSAEQARSAVLDEGADYIGIGAMYPTETKPRHILAGTKLAEAVAALELPVPVFAIGGITLDRVSELRKAGVQRIALSSAIVSAADPETEARRFVEAMAD